MADDSGPPPQADPAELPPDRCPNCGGKLKFSEKRPEGLCSSCGIFVEVLRPSPPKPPVRPLPSKIKIRTATTRELLVLCHKYGLPRGGSKQDLVDRLLMYVDEQGWQAKVSAAEPKTPASPPTEDVASRKQWATFFMDYESEVGEEGEEAKDEKPAPVEPSPPQRAESKPEVPAEPQAEPVPVEIAKAPSPEAAPVPTPPETPPEPALPEEQVHERAEPTEGEPPAPQPEEADLPLPLQRESLPEELPSPPEAEAGPEAEPEVERELPIPEEGIVQSEPVAAESVVQAVPVPAERTSPRPRAQAVPVPSRAPPVQRSRWRRALYYVGVFYVTIGGAGLILGSFLHDFFRVPLFGQAYDSFGRLNVGAVLIGVVLLVVGLAAMAVGLRRTATRTMSATGA